MMDAIYIDRFDKFLKLFERLVVAVESYVKVKTVDPLSDE